jgi:hypothetical protein
MEPIKVTLCSECDQCPCVEIDEKGVRIGEHENMVTLTHAECYTNHAADYSIGTKQHALPGNVLLEVS